MERAISVLTLALVGLIGAAGAFAAQAAHPPSAFREAALVGPAPYPGAASGPRDVIEPPSSVDPGMAIDPPQTGAKMPVIHSQSVPGRTLVLPH